MFDDVCIDVVKCVCVCVEFYVKVVGLCVGWIVLIVENGENVGGGNLLMVFVCVVMVKDLMWIEVGEKDVMVMFFLFVLICVEFLVIVVWVKIIGGLLLLVFLLFFVIDMIWLMCRFVVLV